MNGNVLLGSCYLVQGFKIICKPGFRLFLLVPFCVNTLLFAMLILWVKSLFSGWMAMLLAWVPEWLAFLEWLFWGIYLLVILMTLFYGFVAAANFIGAPFYGYLAEKTEKHLTGGNPEEEFSWKHLASLVPRTLKRELQKIVYYLPRVFALFILSFIPGLNALVALVWIVFSGWMMAIQYIDYSADNHGMSFREMRRYLSNRRLTSSGFGLTALGVTLLPLINLLALPAAVCGAVVFWVNEKRPDGAINLEFDLLHNHKP